MLLFHDFARRPSPMKSRSRVRRHHGPTDHPHHLRPRRGDVQHHAASSGPTVAAAGALVAPPVSSSQGHDTWRVPYYPRRPAGGHRLHLHHIQHLRRPHNQPSTIRWPASFIADHKNLAILAIACGDLSTLLRQHGVLWAKASAAQVDAAETCRSADLGVWRLW